TVGKTRRLAPQRLRIQGPDRRPTGIPLRVHALRGIAPDVILPGPHHDPLRLRTKDPRRGLFDLPQQTRSSDQTARAMRLVERAHCLGDAVTVRTPPERPPDGDPSGQLGEPGRESPAPSRIRGRLVVVANVHAAPFL